MPRGLQEWIHLLEEGAWKRYVKLGTLMLAFIGLAAWYNLKEYRNFSTQEAMDQAQLARNLAEGHGFTTQFVRPVVINFLHQQQGKGVQVMSAPIPDLSNPPLYPLILAGLMKVLPFDYGINTPKGVAFERYQPEFIIALFNQALLVLAIFLVFRIARRLFDETVAWISAVVMAGAEVFWRFSVSGLSTMLLLDLFLALVWVLIALESNERESKHGNGWAFGLAAIAGILLGAGMMTRYAFGWVIIPAVLYLAFFGGSRRVALPLIAAAVFAVCIAPWLVRNYQVGGTLFGTSGYAIYEETTTFPGNRFERTYSGDVDQTARTTEIEEYFRKLIVNGAKLVEVDLPTLGGSWLTAFFFAAILVPFRNPGLNRLRFFLLLTILVLGVAQALGRTHLTDDSPGVNSENLLVLAAPLVFVFGVAMYFVLIDLIEFPLPQVRYLTTVLFVAVISAPLILALMPPNSSPVAYPPYYPPLIQETAELMEPDELLMSDMPWAVAWYGDRNSMLVTLDAPMDSKLSARGDYFAINDFEKPISGLYLTPITLDARFLSEMLKSRESIWGRFVLDTLLRTNVAKGFPLRHARAGLLPDQLFLTDHPRWEQTGPVARK